MISHHDKVVLDYCHLNPGDTLSGQLCPKCEGGGSREHSMSVGRKEQWLWWRCHRASCNFRGSHTHAKFRERSEKRHDLNRLSYWSKDIPESLRHKLCAELHLTEGLISKAGWKWTDDYSGRVVMPIANLDGAVVGELLRSYSGDQPKAMINRMRDGEILSWYSTVKYPSTLVICEDQPSALRVAGVQGIAGVALIGTYLDYERCQEIKRSGIKHLALSLDADATSTAVKYLVNFRSILPSLRLIPLDVDIKNMEQQKFEDYVEQLRALARQ